MNLSCFLKRILDSSNFLGLWHFKEKTFSREENAQQSKSANEIPISFQIKE